MSDSPLTELVTIVENMVEEKLTWLEYKDLSEWLLKHDLELVDQCKETALSAINKT